MFMRKVTILYEYEGYGVPRLFSFKFTKWGNHSLINVITLK